MLKKILIGLLVTLVIIQFFRPEKNESNDMTHAIIKKYELPEEVGQIMKVACNDCHSNKTVYPWYGHVQPVAWWINGHIKDGKRHLNFSEFTNQPLAVQNHKFEEVVEMVEEHEMPLPSYTNLGLHTGANLSGEERKLIMDWAREQMNYLKNTYPADSLVMKPRPPGK
ncbi:MAG TPA: heme-binding domain-containing protein [Eudoraea sp.]|nr:heme-binding domain-containing protein [Eudoraea sp.]